MASEIRRTAEALVELRRETFETRHPLDIAQSRLRLALQRAGIAESARFRTEWREQSGQVLLEALYAPSRATRRFLHASSVAMLLLIGGSVWALRTSGEGSASGFLLPLATVFAILGFPLVALGLGSHREAEESRIRKAILAALAEDEAA